MSKETLQQAVDLAGGQAQLGRGIRERIEGSKVGQVHVWDWLNSAKMEVPPAEVVLAISDFLDYRITPHQLRPDLYPNPLDALPAFCAVEQREDKAA
ncbi:MAG: YdaS family helix-turn-helix protein [Burkholderiaceae bacterium]|nr:YdaS family helix-turn-helix protein [Burkholderiaceae bacterium]